MPKKQDIEKYIINKTLDTYQHLNFVDRIRNKDKYPTLDLGDGSYATHKMSYSTVDNGAVVYPNVIYDETSNSLRELDPEQAYQHAMETKEYIPFDSETDAEWFSKNYKKVWGHE
jgi:hypothetical protein